MNRYELHGGWTLWPWLWVRAAGFPARRILDLASADVARAADEIVTAEASARQARSAALAMLADIRRDQGSLARAALGAANELERGRLPRRDAELEAQVTPLAELRALEASITAARQRLDELYNAERERVAGVIRDVGSDPRFREALVWQNRHALHTGVDWLLAHPAATNSQARQKQALVASYLQRYCVKNDTIGFFGPIAWGRIDGTRAVAAVPGPQLLRERAVHVEHWAVDAIAAWIASWPEVRPHLAPRLLPHVRVDGTTLRYGIDTVSTVSTTIARVLAACDGERTASAIAGELLHDGEIDEPADLYELLDALVARKLLVWTLEPSAPVRTDRALRQLVDGMPDDQARTRALALLDQLEAHRRALEDAAGDAGRLESLFTQLEAWFADVTGQAATRRGGQTYAARTLVFEECVRDLSLTIGSDLLDRLGPVFDLVATSARWFTHEIAAAYRTAVIERFRALRAATSGPVRYLPFWRALDDLMPADKSPGPIVGAMAERLEQAWAEILQLNMTRSHVELRAADLAPAVHARFAAPAPGWPGARHVSPDIMLAGGSAEAIARGDALIVLGEVHIANTLLARLLVPHGPPGDEDAVVREYECDFPQPRVVVVESKEFVTRADNGSWSPRDLDLELGATRSWRAREQVLRSADLVVEDRGETLVVVDQRSGREVDVMNLLETYLIYMGGNHFRPTPSGNHVPRVTIDGVVLCREQWRFTPDQIPGLATESRSQQFAQLRAWARTHGLPRWVFVKVPEEPKPVFVDFDAPVYVEMMAKLVRNGSRVTISEMLPTVEQTWLPDADGNLYTCELRIVAVDPRA